MDYYRKTTQEWDLYCEGQLTSFVTYFCEGEIVLSEKLVCRGKVKNIIISVDNSRTVPESANVAEISMLKSAKVGKDMVRKRKERDADVEECI